MAFYLLFLVGVVGGITGGMGMGGGTLLVPLLVLFGLPQRTAQALSLLSFLPMSFFALRVHRKNGLVRSEALKNMLGFAVFGSLVGALLALVLPSGLLKRAFGLFLTVLSFPVLRSAGKKSLQKEQSMLK